MKKSIDNILFILILTSCFTFFGQQTKSNDIDIDIKNEYYLKYRKQVLAFSHKDYDEMFFEFLTKANDSKKLLTKPEYYTYTIKIAIYSEKLGLLYKDQKESANKTKQEWFDKMYTDYINSKK